MKRLFLTFPRGHLSTVSHSSPTHLQEEPGSSFSASNTVPSCQVKGGRLTFLQSHSVPKTTGWAALAQPSLTPLRNYTQGFSHLYTKIYKLLCISPSYDVPNQVFHLCCSGLADPVFGIAAMGHSIWNHSTWHKFHQHKPFVALLSVCPCFSCTEELRTGHSIQVRPPLVLSRGERTPPSTPSPAREGRHGWPEDWEHMKGW